MRTIPPTFFPTYPEVRMDSSWADRARESDQALGQALPVPQVVPNAEQSK